MRICGIYKITNIINGKMLIGLSNDIIKRWNRHKSQLRNNKHKNTHLQHSWQKYGEQNFRFEIILECSIEKLNEEEIRLIEENKTMDRNFGYNIMEGGFRPRISTETKQKMRLAALGRKNSAESKRKNSLAHMGSKNPMYGIKGTKNKNFGKIFSEEHRQKLKEAKKGKKHNRWGIHLSEETKQKIQETKQRNKNLNSLSIP